MALLGHRPDPHGLPDAIGGNHGKIRGSIAERNARRRRDLSADRRRAFVQGLRSRLSAARHAAGG